MRIAVDALGGDNAPREVVRGALAAAEKLPGAGVILVGSPEEVLPLLPSTLPPNVSFRPSGAGVGMSEEPAAALKARPDASVALAASLVRRGEASALFSAGSTGAAVAAALLGIGRLKGCRRPAIATVLPFPKPVLLLDAGATVACRPQDLVNFAILGSVFAKKLFGLEGEARVGLVNVGEEPGKGDDLAREAHRLLALSNVRFVGNVEGRDLGEGVADVLVTDGFTGNVLLKTAEGTSRALLGMIWSAVAEANLPTRIAALVLRRRLREVRDLVDPENYGGSFLLGVRAQVVIGHGNSRARGVENALLNLARAGDGLTEDLQAALLEPSLSGGAP